MSSLAEKGNNSALWNKFLSILDERLQLGLLEHLRKIVSYHFEDETLFLECSTEEEYNYFSRPSVKQQLLIFAKEACTAYTKDEKEQGRENKPTIEEIKLKR